MKPDSNLKWTVAITIAVGYALPVHVEDSSCANGLLRSLAPYSQEPTRRGGTVASTTTAPGISNQAFERESGVFPLALFSGARREISVSGIAISCIDATLIMDDFATNLLGPRERKSPADRTRAGSVDVYSWPRGPGSQPVGLQSIQLVARALPKPSWSRSLLDHGDKPGTHRWPWVEYTASWMVHWQTVCCIVIFGVLVARLWGAIAAGHPSASVGRQGFWFE